MRVIAGIAKGRKLRVAAGTATRPTPARVREALFSMLHGRLGGARVLDLFAGSGALGIEALSRGARAAVFCEVARPALAALRHNLAPWPQHARVLAMPAAAAVRRLAAAAEAFDVCFCDPPYAQHASGQSAALLAQLAAEGLLAPGGVVVCEHHGRMAVPTAPGGWATWRTRRFGDVALSLMGADAGG